MGDGRQLTSSTSIRSSSPRTQIELAFRYNKQGDNITIARAFISKASSFDLESLDGKSSQSPNSNVHFHPSLEGLNEPSSSSTSQPMQQAQDELESSQFSSRWADMEQIDLIVNGFPKSEHFSHLKEVMQTNFDSSQFMLFILSLLRDFDVAQKIFKTDSSDQNTKCRIRIHRNRIELPVSLHSLVLIFITSI